MNYTVTIVGGGISGLTVAYRLLTLKKQNNLPVDITLIESSDRLGGVIKSELNDNFVVEHGPDAFLSEKPEIRNLLTELELTTELVPTNEKDRRAFIAKKNKLIPLPKGFFLIAPTKLMPFLTSPLFSWFGKLRIMLEIFVPQRNSPEDESVSDFISRRFGQELMVRAGQPLVGGIYMADINLLSNQSTLPNFIEIEKKHGSILKGLNQHNNLQADTAVGARYKLFSSLRNGTESLVDKLASKLVDVKISLNTSALNISHHSKKNWLIETTNDQIATDAIVFAIPAKAASKTIKHLNIDLANKLAKIDSSNSLVVNLLYKKSDIKNPKKGFGFVVPRTENKKIIAASFISQKFAFRANENHEMIRVFISGQLHPELFQLSNEELIDLAHNEITPFLKIEGLPVKTWIARYPAGLPFYQTGHKDIVKNINEQAKDHP